MADNNLQVDKDYNFINLRLLSLVCSLCPHNGNVMLPRYTISFDSDFLNKNNMY